MSSFEEHQRALDPHRDAELQGVEAEVAARLRNRGVLLTGRETPEEMADLLDAVERFDAAVESLGGDLFVDSPARPDDMRVEQPDNPQFVLPRRNPDERVRDYVRHIDDAIGRLA
jgi:hypothetical protein